MSEIKIKEISLSANLKIPHPSINYSTIGSNVTLSADVPEGVSETDVFAALQEKADNFLAAHIKALHQRCDKSTTKGGN